MGIQERKQRQKEELRDIILKAARELFLERGFQATSMRNIAERIEYSPATIYLHFRDKDEMFYALHQEGFSMLVNYFKTLNTVADPFERLKAMGRVYIQFATENPDFYRLMFVMAEPLACLVDSHTPEWNEGEDAFRFLMNTVAECQTKGYFKGLDPLGLSFNVWFTVHGMAALMISGHLDHMQRVKDTVPNNISVPTMSMESYMAMLDRLK